MIPAIDFTHDASALIFEFLRPDEACTLNTKMRTLYVDITYSKLERMPHYKLLGKCFEPANSYDTAHKARAIQLTVLKAQRTLKLTIFSFTLLNVVDDANYLYYFTSIAIKHQGAMAAYMKYSSVAHYKKWVAENEEELALKKLL